MGTAYRCDKCGQMRDGEGWNIDMYDGSKGSSWTLSTITSRVQVELCPDCAAPLREQLQAIAATTHTA